MKNKRLEHTFTIWGLILIAWACYRVYFSFPEWVDELIVKPLIFLGPVLFYVLQIEHKKLTSIGWMKGKFGRDLKLSLIFGGLFFFEGTLVNIIKHQKLSLLPQTPIVQINLLLVIILSLATSFNEETLVRGFLYTRLKAGYKSVVKAMLVSAVLYLVLLIPIIFTTTKLTSATLVIFVMTNLMLSFTNTMIFNETKTITVPTLIHAFWNMAVMLYL